MSNHSELIAKIDHLHEHLIAIIKDQEGHSTLLRRIFRKVGKMAGELDALTAQVSKNTDVINSAIQLIQNIKALLVEFGVAEVIDLFIIRPALMYYLPLWIENLAFGTLVAKLLAYLTFYIPAIMSYELSKRWLREFS